MEVQSVLETIDDVTRKVTFTVPAERVDREYSSSLGQVAKSANLKGFRKGKAPKPLVEKLLGDRVRFDVMNRLVSEAIRNVAEEHSLDVVGEPELSLKEFEKTAPFEFSATLYLFPKPSIANYKGRTVEVVRRKVSDTDVEDAIKRIRDARSELKKVEDRAAAAKGDVLAMSVTVLEEGQAEGRAEPFVDELGAGKLPAPVEDGIVGLEVGGEREIPYEVPAETDESVSGKKLTYKVVLHGIYEKQLPEIDDAFVSGLNMGIESATDLPNKVREELEAQAEREAKLDAQEAILNLLVKDHEFAVPQVLIDREIQGMVSRYSRNYGQGVKADQIPVDKFRDSLGSHALERIRCSIIVDRIAEQEAVQVSEEDANRIIHEYARQNGSSAEQARQSILSSNSMDAFYAEARRSKALELLVDQSSVTYTDAPPPQEKVA
jgi:trigger factor